MCCYFLAAASLSKVSEQHGEERAAVASEECLALLCLEFQLNPHLRERRTFRVLSVIRQTVSFAESTCSEHDLS